MNSPSSPKSSDPAPPRSLRRARLRAMLGPLRTFLWVGAISLLVWIWADLERTESAQVSVVLKIVPQSGSDVRVDSPDPRQGRRVVFTCTGSPMAVHELRQQARAGTLVYEVTAEPDWVERGERFVNTVELLNQWPYLREAGVTVGSAEPDQVHVVLGRWRVVQAIVEPVMTGPALEGAPAVQPVQVAVRVPTDATLPPAPTIRTEPVDVTGIAPGTRTARRVALQTTIAGVRVEPVQNEMVEVAFTVAQPMAADSVRVTAELKLPPEWIENDTLANYTLERPGDGWTRELPVRGPRMDIERLKAGRTRVYAFLELRTEDLSPGPSLNRPVTVVLPENIELREPLNWNVDIELRRRP